jgi:hypothetical protein
MDSFSTDSSSSEWHRAMRLDGFLAVPRPGRLREHDAHSQVPWLAGIVAPGRRKGWHPKRTESRCVDTRMSHPSSLTIVDMRALERGKRVKKRECGAA